MYITQISFATEGKFVFQMHSEARQTRTLEFRAEKGLLQVREGRPRICDQVVHSSLVDGDQSLGARRSENYQLVIIKWLTSSIWWWF